MYTTSILNGGLGNMLFQIAAAYGVAAVTRTSVGFNLYERTNVEHLKHLRGVTSYSYADNYFRNLSNCEFQINNQWNILDDTVNINMLKTSQNYMLKGYFQSEIYFKHIESNIVSLFECPTNISDYIHLKYGNIFKKPTISMHVRRADYLKLQDYHPSCPVEYYKKALSMIGEKSCNVLLFSDDPVWCQDSLKDIQHTNVIEPDYISLYMMSCCNHNVIANSSYSWWGAWLNQNKNKKVIAPAPWFGPGKSEQDRDMWNKNIYCKDWEVVHV